MTADPSVRDDSGALKPALVADQRANPRQRRFDPEFVAPSMFAFTAAHVREPCRRQGQHAQQTDPGGTPMDFAIVGRQLEAEFHRTQALAELSVARAQAGAHAVATEA